MRNTNGGPAVSAEPRWAPRWWTDPATSKERIE